MSERRSRSHDSRSQDSQLLLFQFVSSESENFPQKPNFTFLPFRDLESLLSSVFFRSQAEEPGGITKDHIFLGLGTLCHVVFTSKILQCPKITNSLFWLPEPINFSRSLFCLSSLQHWKPLLDPSNLKSYLPSSTTPGSSHDTSMPSRSLTRAFSLPFPQMGAFQGFTLNYMLYFLIRLLLQGICF